MKIKFKKILVPLDGSKNSFRGLDYAIFLARSCQATVTGIWVTHLSPPVTAQQKAYIKNYLLKNAHHTMRMAKTRCAKKGVLFSSKIVHGDEGSDIIKFAQNRKFDLIVIGSRGMGSIKQAFLGSTSNYVIHKSKVPVLLVK